MLFHHFLLFCKDIYNLDYFFFVTIITFTYFVYYFLTYYSRG